MDKMYYIDFGGNGVEYTVKEDLKISEKVALVSEYAETVVSKELGYAPLLKNIMYNYLLIKYYTDITVFDNEDNINIDEVEVFIKANGTLIDSINVHPDIEDACKEALEYRINHYNNESVVADFFTALTNAINKFADRDSIDFDTVNRLIDVLLAVKDMDNKEVAKAIVKEFHNDNKGLSYDVSKQPQKSNKGRKPKTEFTVEKGEKTE